MINYYEAPMRSPKLAVWGPYDLGFSFTPSRVNLASSHDELALHLPIATKEMTR